MKTAVEVSQRERAYALLSVGRNNTAGVGDWSTSFLS